MWQSDHASTFRGCYRPNFPNFLRPERDFQFFFCQSCSVINVQNMENCKFIGTSTVFDPLKIRIVNTKLNFSDVVVFNRRHVKLDMIGRRCWRSDKYAKFELLPFVNKYCNIFHEILFLFNVEWTLYEITLIIYFLWRYRS